VLLAVIVTDRNDEKFSYSHIVLSIHGLYR